MVVMVGEPLGLELRLLAVEPVMVVHFLLAQSQQAC